MFKISKNSAFKSWKSTTYCVSYNALIEMVDINQDLPFKIEDLLINSSNSIINNEQFMEWIKTLKIKNINDNLQFYQK